MTQSRVNTSRTLPAVALLAALNPFRGILVGAWAAAYFAIKLAGDFCQGATNIPKSGLMGLCLAAFFANVPANAQETTVDGIKARGATVLSGNELRSLLAGATVRYEVPQFVTQMKLDASGSVVGSSVTQLGNLMHKPIPFIGQWKINDKAHWCVAYAGFAPIEDNFCRIVLKLANKYYFAAGEASGDASQVFEMSVSK